jgi:hypothetical protein
VADADINKLSADMQRLREEYVKKVGGTLTHDVPVDLRMSASGIGKGSRMIGGNLAELIANNIIGNLRSKPLPKETLMEQIKREPLAKAVVEGTASGVEARKLGEMYKEALGLRGKYGEEFVFQSLEGNIEKAVAGTVHMMVMKEPRSWVPKGSESMVKGESKMTIDPHAWFGLQKLFKPGGAVAKEFTLRAFPEAREAGSFIDALRSFAKPREEELVQKGDLKRIGPEQLLDTKSRDYVAPLKRRATAADLGQTIFDPFKFGKPMLLELPTPSEGMQETIATDVEAKVKRGEQAMPVKKMIEIPEITARQYVTSDTGEVLPSTVSRYLTELVEAVRKYYALQQPSKDPESIELKRTFSNAIVGDFYNKIHPVMDVNTKKELLSKMEEQVLPLVEKAPMPQFSAKSSVITDPNDPHKAWFPTMYERLEPKIAKQLEADMKKGITVGEAYKKYIKGGTSESISDMNYQARFLRDLVSGPVIYADKSQVGQKVTKDISTGDESGFTTKNLVTDEQLDKVLGEFKQYEVKKDELVSLPV